MSTITAILEAHADGTLHLPLPAELRQSKLKVTATIEAASEPSERPSHAAALAALRHLQTRSPFNPIADPVEWQREIRRDRSVPGRD